MSYLHHVTHSGRRFAPNQEEHYPETLSDTTESSVFFEIAPDRPPTYEEAIRSKIHLSRFEIPLNNNKMSTQNNTTFATETLEFQESQEHISQNLQEEITQEISKLLEKISNLDKTIENYQLHREAAEVDIKTQQWNRNVEHIQKFTVYFLIDFYVLVDRKCIFLFILDQPERKNLLCIFYFNRMNVIDFVEEEWIVEEPSSSTGIKKVEPSSMQVEQEDFSVIEIKETLFKSYTFE
ncbi:28031_t:CDS:2 [Dentiscutata erythropus]|uniref:28031_t:CDS:1 n=1 Tax=Dentiscutata erythropus TaxID=1348616 RepID=A0A9N9JTS4_9GLOM|nr:28031_t:CDS:2 [Dentiscutata erythropus]